MIVFKKITEDNEFLLYLNGELIYKRWLKTGQSKVFDVMAYDKYTLASYTDLDVENSNQLFIVHAKVRFKRTDEGGRFNGIRSGYRPNHVFEYQKNGSIKDTYIGDIQFTGLERLELGQVYDVHVRFLTIQQIEKFLKPGRKWWLHEGPTLVGEAQITDFFPPEIS